ncbi:hypothetical protein MFRU_036g00460 [Monilinia fructicola]|nr:hypothetical protein MFRU_036g00460 [Monilinia fructicola]
MSPKSHHKQQHIRTKQAFHPPLPIPTPLINKRPTIPASPNVNQLANSKLTKPRSSPNTGIDSTTIHTRIQTSALIASQETALSFARVSACSHRSNIPCNTSIAPTRPEIPPAITIEFPRVIARKSANLLSGPEMGGLPAGEGSRKR